MTYKRSKRHFRKTKAQKNCARQIVHQTHLVIYNPPATKYGRNPWTVDYLQSSAEGEHCSSTPSVFSPCLYPAFLPCVLGKRAISKCALCYLSGSGGTAACEKAGQAARRCTCWRTVSYTLSFSCQLVILQAAAS